MTYPLPLLYDRLAAENIETGESNDSSPGNRPVCRQHAPDREIDADAPDNCRVVEGADNAHQEAQANLL